MRLIVENHKRQQQTQPAEVSRPTRASNKRAKRLDLGEIASVSTTPEPIKKRSRKSIAAAEIATLEAEIEEINRVLAAKKGRLEALKKGVEQKTK